MISAFRRKLLSSCLSLLLASLFLFYAHEYPLLLPTIGTFLFSLASYDRKKLLLRVLLVFMITLFALYPSPSCLARQMIRVRDPRSLVEPKSRLIEDLCAERKISFKELNEIEPLIYRVLPYRFDYFSWLAADYWSTADEALKKGFEDCDGRAIVACSLLRSLGYEAYVVMGLDHAWVRVVFGDETKELLWPRPPEIMRFNENYLERVGLLRELRFRLFPPIFYFDSLMLLALTIWLSFCQIVASREVKSGILWGIGSLPLNFLISYAFKLLADGLPQLVPSLLVLVVPAIIRFPPSKALISISGFPRILKCCH